MGDIFHLWVLTSGEKCGIFPPIIGVVCYSRHRSSEVEQGFCKPLVGGSIPSGGFAH
jgi:hypothetical protein